MKPKNDMKNSYPGSEKIYVPGKLYNIQVGMRKVNLTDTVKIIDSFRESAMQISAACEKRAVLFRLSCSLLLAVRKAVSPTAKARFNSGRECHPAAMFCFLP